MHQGQLHVTADHWSVTVGLVMQSKPMDYNSYAFTQFIAFTYLATYCILAGNVIALLSTRHGLRQHSQHEQNNSL